MTHDTEAQTATQKIATEFRNEWNLGFSKKTIIESASASIPKRNIWPIPDGAISLRVQGQKNGYPLAIEYKRPEEGKHGILTALGQSISYIENGRFAASIIVVPKAYSLNEKRQPGDFLTSVLQNSAPGQPIGVWVYDQQKHLTCIKKIELDKLQVTKSSKKIVQESLPNKQWMYVRSGEYNPDLVYKYLKTAKQLKYLSNSRKISPLHPQIKKVCQRLYPKKIPENVLSNSPNDKHEDIIWRKFWYTYWFTKDVQTIWKKKKGKYVVNEAPSDILQWGKTQMIKYATRKDSIKVDLVNRLNAKEIHEQDAWEEFVEYISKSAAHSAKETVDSAIDALGFVDEYGNPTSLGYQFVDEAEKQPDGPYGVICLKILRYAMLTVGGYFNLLKKFHELSEEKFDSDFDAFWQKKSRGSNFEFKQNDYLKWLEDELVKLCIMYKQETPTSKKKKTKSKKTPFQDDITILKQFGFIKQKKTPYLRGVGLQINWPFINESMNADKSLT
jgi:hypothetical protein